MCTVTIMPLGKSDFVLTSNRDEAPDRVSLVPEFYTVDTSKLLFPKDVLSDGTWIGVSDKNRVICVLNGAFEFHQRKLNYRKSRGVVAKDFMVAEDLESTMSTYNLGDIEPFTMVVVDWNTTLRLYELVWDGLEKHVSPLPLEPRIWSSSTLYSGAMKAERLRWFQDFKKEGRLAAKTLLEFHKTAGNGNDDYGVVMNRGFVKTTSITQVEKTNDVVNMRYKNLQSNVCTENVYNLPQVVNE
ncbi:NRDE family protein [Changchengzhania lutea]|uniref:NRDE family protein n=1 Tax=Changchengzhania lutea TaxID=2049305 RepID=UPI00115DBE79|nr:NRDE family protein [Changchengzhania lutea]